ncbi:hypothetical protein ACT4ZU_03860 [Acinetobacter baumannii]
MKFELKNFLINICGWIFLISVCFFLIVLSIFIKDGVQQPIKETLTLTLSFLSALATIGAAIIAARIFQTWKTQHSYIEQTKILSEMIQTIDNIVFTLVDVRQNDNLKRILLDEPCRLPVSDPFLEQIKFAKLLETQVTKLTSLENQIYLLNNDGRVAPVFTRDDQGNCYRDKITKLTASIDAGISSTYELLSVDKGCGTFSISNLDLKEPEIQEMILYSLIEGDEVLRHSFPEFFNLDDNPINIELNKCIKGLQQKIMDYRDSLDTLN